MFHESNGTARDKFPVKDEPFFDDDLDDLLPAHEEDIQVKVNPEDFVQFEQNPSDFECTICQETYNSAEDYDYHIYQFHHDVDAAEMYYKCEECKIDFARPSELRKHISAVHESSNKYASCDKSDKASKRRTESTKNAKSAASHKNEKEYQCEKCDKRFVTYPRLKAHLNHVHGGKTYECNKCDKVFARKGDLKKHLEHVHDGVKNYNCDR